MPSPEAVATWGIAAALLMVGTLPIEGDHLPTDSIVKFIVWFHGHFPTIGTLLLMMSLDILLGICAAIITNTLSSSVSHRGMVRKTVKLLLVGVGAVLEPYANGLPLASLIAMFFILTEGKSIIENSARAGVPVPPRLLEALAMLNNNEKASVQKAPSQQNTTTVQVDRVSNMTISTAEPSHDPANVHADSGSGIVVNVTEVNDAARHD